MLLSIRSFIIFLAIFFAAGIHAKTLRYELEAFASSNGQINYPGLDFYNAQSATLVVERSAELPEPELVSLDLVFPNAATLKVRDFKRYSPGVHRALVSGAWIFKEVLVEVNILELLPGHPVQIDVKVVETTSNINPTFESSGPFLLHAQGLLKDVTPTKVADTNFAIINGKRVNLSLKDRLFIDGSSPRFGIAIEAVWLGQGSRTLYIAPPVPIPQFDFAEPIALIIETMNISGNVEHMVSVKLLHLGDELTTPPYPLKDLLNEAYGL